MNKIFTLKALALVLTMGATFFSNRLYSQADTGTGTGWSTLNPTDPMVLKENFQGYKFFHSDTTANMGNSNNVVDEVTGLTIPGYTNLDTSYNYIGSSVYKVHMKFDTCAFAPKWKAANAYRDSAENTPGVTDGFVEISRKYSGTVRGYFTVDLRELEFVEAIQYSHSSCGGNKRGVLVQYSIDGGITWDSLRYQPGTSYATSFTTDIFTKQRTPNSYRCDPSAYGMLWEDAIYADNLMIRFLESGGQVVRIHDLKVYATLKGVGVKQFTNNLGMRIMNGNISFSNEVDVSLYSISGTRIKSENSTRNLFIGDLQNGIYIARARFEGKVAEKKIVIRNR